MLFSKRGTDVVKFRGGAKGKSMTGVAGVLAPSLRWAHDRPPAAEARVAEMFAEIANADSLSKA